MGSGLQTDWYVSHSVAAGHYQRERGTKQRSYCVLGTECEEPPEPEHLGQHLRHQGAPNAFEERDSFHSDR